MAAVGEPDIKEKLKAGHAAAGKKFKVYLDGYNFLPYFTGKEEKGPRKEFFYWNDGGQLVGLRYNHWKLVFMEQREKTFNVWTDPFERASTDSNNYNTWWIRRVFAMVPAQTYVSEYIATFKDFPPRQKPAKFNVDDALATLKSASGNN